MGLSPRLNPLDYILRIVTMEYTQAKFWKCALQVNPTGYIKYRGQEQALSESDYNQKLLEVCVQENIKVLGIADHGNVDGVDAVA